METRDKLNTIEGYQEIIDNRIKFIKEIEIDILEIEEDEKNGIQKHPNPNIYIIKSSKDDILMYQYELILTKYSKGVPILDLKGDYIAIIASMEESWRQRNGYVQMVWMLSIGIMLEIEQEEFNKLVEIVKSDDPKDYLIDFLIQYRNSSWGKQSTNFKHEKPYKSIIDIVSLAQTDKQKAIEKLQKYLQKEWYKGHKDCGWYDSHKSKWNIHSGYWSFESGALVKILGLDDSILKDQQYYPYDMVHGKE